MGLETRAVRPWTNPKVSNKSGFGSRRLYVISLNISHTPDRKCLSKVTASKFLFSTASSSRCRPVCSPVGVLSSQGFLHLTYLAFQRAHTRTVLFQISNITEFIAWKKRNVAISWKGNVFPFPNNWFNYEFYWIIVRSLTSFLRPFVLLQFITRRTLFYKYLLFKFYLWTKYFVTDLKTINYPTY